MQFVTDGWICVTISLAVIFGGIGFPVWLELRRQLRRPTRWSLHTKLTLLMTGLLLAVGFFTVLGFEWGNPGTLGPLDPAGKLLAAFFQGVQPRTAGFNTVDYAQMDESTLLFQDVLMFVGAGSASTGGRDQGGDVRPAPAHGLDGDPGRPGGQRVRPPDQRRRAAAGPRGEPDRVRGGRHVHARARLGQRRFGVSQSIFESASAFGTVGLSTGITADLPEAGKVALIVLMYLGRVGPHAIGTALVLREHVAATATRRAGRSSARVWRRMAREQQFLVIGLGRFGGALAETLVELGHEVLGVDLSEKLVQSYADELTHVVQCDTTDPGGDGADRCGRVRDRDRRDRDRRGGQHPDDVGPRRPRSLTHRGQGDHGSARQDPRARRRAPRHLPRARHGRSASATA